MSLSYATLNGVLVSEPDPFVAPLILPLQLQCAALLAARSILLPRAHMIIVQQWIGLPEVEVGYGMERQGPR